jgi:hypothetical protein
MALFNQSSLQEVEIGVDCVRLATFRGRKVGAFAESEGVVVEVDSVGAGNPVADS